MAANTNDMLKKTGASTVTTLSAPGKALAATSINVGSTTNYPTDTGFVVAIRQVDSNGDLVANTYTEWSATVSSATSLAIVATPVYGSDQVYPAGSTTQVYIPLSAYAHNKLIDNILEHANQDGSLISQAVRDALNLDSGSSDGWTPFGYSLTSITALGNRSYTAVVSGVDTTGVTSVGMRLKLPRTVTAPIQCTDLESGSSQYFNRTSAGLGAMTFTDDFTVSAWVKLESYTGAIMSIATRYNGTSGWYLSLDASGRVVMFGHNAASGNYRGVTSYQSIPLNKWVHITAFLDMSGYTYTSDSGATNNYIMIDGTVVPGYMGQAGTNPVVLVQAGNLEIGSVNSGTLPFDGKIAQVAIYSARILPATIRASANQTLTGSEASLVCGYTFNGVVTDVSTNGYTLTAQNSAAATNADTPFTNSVTGTSVTAGTTNYGIIMAQTFSTNTTYTIQIPEGETLPTTGGIGTVSYSTQKTPYGFPGETGKWVVESVKTTLETVSFGGTGSWYASNMKITIPIGAWIINMQIAIQAASTVSGQRNAWFTLAGTSTFTVASGVYAHPMIASVFANSTTDAIASINTTQAINLASSEIFTVTGQLLSSTGTETYKFPYNNSYGVIRATNAYL